MDNAPMKITLYDPETNEIKHEFIRSFVPWRLLKKAIRLSKRLSGVDEDSISEEDADAIASLVVDTFGDQFTVEDLNQGASLREMMTVLRIIIADAEGISLNPPPQEKRK